MIEAENEKDNDVPPSVDVVVRLSRNQLWDITFLVLAFSCVVATLTLVVGTGAVVILSVGGSSALAPFSLAVVFMGMSFMSLTATHWIFTLWGRRIGFWVGCAIGIVGVLLGCWGLVQSSPGIVLVAQTLMGGGLGMGMYLRYSAVEVVPADFSSRAVTWVLAGGCLAAFVGPEVSQATKGLFGDDADDDDGDITNLTYMGTFVVAGGFFVLQAICVGLVGFPPSKSTKQNDAAESKESTSDEILDTEETEVGESMHMDSEPTTIGVSRSATSSDEVTTTIWRILRQPNFLLPVGVAILAWAIMAMPMGIFRITMAELGYTERQSLTVIEFHFLAMYAPGFWSGSLIKKHGVLRVCQLAIVCFVLGLGTLISIQDNNNSSAGWFLGLIMLGVGWNFAFSSATVWSTESYQHAMHLKAKVQAANECGMFFFSGGAIFSTGYLYAAGGGGIGGWRLLNATLFAFVALLVALVIKATRLVVKASHVSSGAVGAIFTIEKEKGENDSK